MDNFDFKKCKMLQENPFTYISTQIMIALKNISFIMGVVFLLLYLFDKIDWSLWLVTLPFWYYIPVVIIAIFCDYIRDLLRNKKK